MADEQKPTSSAPPGSQPQPPPGDAAGSFLDFIAEQPGSGSTPAAAQGTYPQPAQKKAEPLIPEAEVVIEHEQAQTKTSASEVLEAIPEADASESSSLEQEPSFGEKLSEIVKELNINPQAIAKVIGCLLLLVALVIASIFGYRYYAKNYPGKITGVIEQLAFWKDAESVAEDEEEPEKIPEEALPPGQDQTGVRATSFFGTFSSEELRRLGATGVSAARSVGDEGTVESQLADYIMTFRRLENAFLTNIDEMLNKSTDRRARLRSHRALLQNLYDEATANLVKMDQELAKLSAEYEAGSQEQNTLDKNFFEQVDALNAPTAEDLLDRFIIQSQQQIRLKAQFQGLQKVRSFYVRGLPTVQKLIQAIDLNEEALVEGVKFYEVMGIDLGLFRPLPGQEEGNGQQATGNSAGGQTTSSQASSSLTIAPQGFKVGDVTTGLPIHPAQVQTRYDFITQPAPSELIN